MRSGYGSSSTTVCGPAWRTIRAPFAASSTHAVEPTAIAVSATPGT